MQKITLYDELIFLPAEPGIVIHCPGSPFPKIEDNFVFAAAQSIFAYATYRSGGIEITIKKKIPLAAGLGGGSSECRDNFNGLKRNLRISLNGDDLMKLGAKLGADVPFFIFGRTAWASGIGDQLKAEENLPSFYLS